MLGHRKLVAHSRGFTVIEVLVTMGIAALALGLGAPAFRVWLENVQVRTVAESIQNGLQVARAEALRGNCNATFALSTDTSWTVTATCPDLTTNAISTKTIQSRGARDGSSSNVTAALDPAGATVVFNGMGRVDNASPLTKVDVASSAGTKALRIDIGGGGQIRMCDPGVSAANDPRKCK